MNAISLMTPCTRTINIIRVHHCRQPMRNNDGRPPAAEVCQATLHRALADNIQRHSALIEHYNRRLLEDAPRNTAPTQLSTTQRKKTFTDNSVQTFRLLSNKIGRRCPRKSLSAHSQGYQTGSLAAHSASHSYRATTGTELQWPSPYKPETRRPTP
jgi:hypothetical protein